MLQKVFRLNRCFVLLSIEKPSRSSENATSYTAEDVDCEGIIIFCYLEQQYHRLSKRFKVVHVVETAFVFDVHEEGHSEYGEDEHHEEKQEADVEESRQRHCKGEQ